MSCGTSPCIASSTTSSKQTSSDEALNLTSELEQLTAVASSKKTSDSALTCELERDADVQQQLMMEARKLHTTTLKKEIKATENRTRHNANTQDHMDQIQARYTTIKAYEDSRAAPRPDAPQ